ncbi:MAG: hypothetical protein WDM78_13955 [Puia sp.]
MKPWLLPAAGLNAVAAISAKTNADLMMVFFILSVFRRGFWKELAAIAANSLYSWLPVKHGNSY